LLRIKQSNGWFSKKKIKAVVMNKKQNHWQCSNERISSFNEWRLFIKEYQSSPTELVVSAINERDGEQKQKKKEGLETLEDEEAIKEDGAVKIMGALGEVVARKILYFSTFEDMQFTMNGLNIHNLFGEGNEVMNRLANYHKETFKFNVLRLLGASNLIGQIERTI